MFIYVPGNCFTGLFIANCTIVEHISIGIGFLDPDLESQTDKLKENCSHGLDRGLGASNLLAAITYIYIKYSIVVIQLQINLLPMVSITSPGSLSASGLSPFTAFACAGLRSKCN